MKLDLGSFAFGSFLPVGGSPSWGTALGQGKGLKFSYPGWDNIIAGMLYKAIPTSKVYIPLGKGGHVYNGLDDEGIQVAALFDQVYINEVRIPAPFIMIIYRDSSVSWDGRRTLKYSDKIEYQQDSVTRIKNADFIAAAREALQLSDDANWIINDLYIEDQEILHMFAGIVNPNQSETYATGEQRKAAWIEAIQHTLADSSVYKKYLSGETIKTACTDSQNAGCQQIIFYGAPGTGKSHGIKEATEEAEKIGNVFRTTFHPDSDYSTFIGAYKPTMAKRAVRNVAGDIVKNNGQEVFEETIVYKFTPQAFTNAYIRAWQTIEPVYLVIEEINRGNCAQIFGDLFQLLDRDDEGKSKYPIIPDTDLGNYIESQLLNYDNVPEEIRQGKSMLLPSNLFIWASMNTSDQSLFPIDSAFKRRWDWKYVPIENAHKNYVIQVNKTEYDWWEFLTAINKEVFELTNSEDKQLGYFFVKKTDGIIDAETLVNKVYFYLWNDVFKDYDLDSQKAFRNQETQRAISFKEFFEGGLNEELAEQVLLNLEVQGKPLDE